MSQSLAQPPAQPLAVTVAMDTDVGQQREHNQDAIGQLVPTEPDILAELGQIFVLADGVGGLHGGDLASQYAVSTIISSYYEQEEGDPSDRLARAIAEANNVIFAEGQEQDPPVIMATTTVVAIVRGHDLIIGSVGDSPAYLMRDADARKLTLDHTVEAMAEESGVALPEGEEIKRKLVRALGSMPSVKVDIITGRVRSGDHVVLCSDGLTRYVTPEEIEEAVAIQPPDQAVSTLIALANERGGGDNISVIVLRLADPVTEDHLVQLPRIPDPMEAWGRPRPERATMPEDEQIALPRARPRTPKPPVTLSADSPLRDLWQLLRGNTVLTGIGLGVLLVIFVIIMIVLANWSDGDENTAQNQAETATQAVNQTATATLVVAATQQAAALETSDAIQAATAAESARRTLTPPTPVPTSGPQLENTTWFRVLPGDPIPAFQEPDRAAGEASPLEAGESYRVTDITHNLAGSPWYRVVDNLGVEGRWVSAPTMHQRIVVVDTAGNPLPEPEQPLDLPPPDLPTWTPTPYVTPTPLPTLPGTPGTSVSPIPPTITPTPRPAIPYGVENWENGDQVVMKDALDLCEVPDVTACEAGQADAGEIGTITDGPAPSGAHWWWQVEFEDGRKGWIAQVLLDVP